MITQNLIVENSILILHGDWYKNFLHKSKRNKWELDVYY